MAPHRRYKRSAAEALAEDICVEIQRRGLQEGDVLSTEGELMQRHGLSRSVVRDAVSRLRALDILRTRQRTGLVVGRANPVAILRLAFPFAGTGEGDLLQVAQMRYALEVGAIDLAARLATETQLTHLRTTLAEYTHAVESDAETITITFTDAVFHGLILEMSGNPLLAGMHAVLEEHFRLWSEVRDRRTARMSEQERQRHAQRSIWEHRMITESLCRRDGEQARAFLREHLRAWNGSSEGDGPGAE